MPHLKLLEDSGAASASLAVFAVDLQGIIGEDVMIDDICITPNW